MTGEVCAKCGSEFVADFKPGPVSALDEARAVDEWRIRHECVTPDAPVKAVADVKLRPAARRPRKRITRSTGSR